MILKTLLAVTTLGSIPAYTPSVRADFTYTIDRNHPLASNYAPVDLVELKSYQIASTPEERLMHPAAAKALTTMLHDANKVGISFKLSSGYRSYQLQKQIYRYHSQYIVDDKHLVAQPGLSEHQTGLAADLVLSDNFCSGQQCFIISKGYAWLVNNSFKYGFIIRYPLGEEASTGYQFEPWHLRYIGKEAAKEIHSQDSTLEKYHKV